MVRDNTAQEVMPKNCKSWEERNSFNTCPIKASEESIGIYAKNRY